MVLTIALCGTDVTPAAMVEPDRGYCRLRSLADAAQQLIEIRAAGPADGEASREWTGPVHSGL